jgi:hypothetical protein
MLVLPQSRTLRFVRQAAGAAMQLTAGAYAVRS